MDIKTDSSKTILRHRPLIFLDLEFTGLLTQKHEIIEIGALKVEPKKPFKILSEFNLKVKPKYIERADQEALKITHYSPDSWKNALELKEALEQLDEFADNGVLVGYNVSADWAMLDKVYFQENRQDPFYYLRIDVMSIAYAKLFSRRTLKRFSLGEVSKYLKIDRGTQHRALDDSKTTYLVFRKLMELNK